jgi:hypothetical protein
MPTVIGDIRGSELRLLADVIARRGRLGPGAGYARRHVYRRLHSDWSPRGAADPAAAASGASERRVYLDDVEPVLRRTLVRSADAGGDAVAPAIFADAAGVGRGL